MLLPTTRENSWNSSSSLSPSSSSSASSSSSSIASPMPPAGDMTGKRKREDDLHLKMNQLTSMNSMLMQQMQVIQQQNQLQQQQHRETSEGMQQLQQQLSTHEGTVKRNLGTFEETARQNQMEQMRHMQSVVASVDRQGVFVPNLNLDNMNDFDLAVDQTES